MRKQTKLVAVLSAAALLAMGASMTSFAAGWERDEAGVWHYYDSDDEMVYGEWKKDNGKWFYLDDEGDMLTDAWVDDEYYVGANGEMLINSWIKTTADDEVDDPEEDGDNWYYFGSKGKKTTESKKINGRNYFFDDDGKMEYGWYQDSKNDIFYLGEEDEGWRTESGWLWLARPDDDDEIDGCDDECSICDEEGWYYFGSNGKMYKDEKRKKVNGRYYYFNEHGQMLYEWIDGSKVKATTPSNAVKDGEATPAKANIGNMLYMNQVEEGWRADGWYEIDGAEDVGTDNDTDWYYFDDGEPERADINKDAVGVEEDNEKVYRVKIKVKASNNKYFCFDEVGRMQTGLQFMGSQKGFYYFDDNGYLKTGKLSNIEDDDDSFTFYFNTKNGRNGEGVNGVKDNYLYFGGKRLEADDDYKLYYVEGKTYLVNNKGKIQKSNSKKYDIEGIGEDITVTFSGSAVASFKDSDGVAVTDDRIIGAITMPEINLYDNTYTYVVVNENGVLSFARDWGDTIKTTDYESLALFGIGE